FLGALRGLKVLLMTASLPATRLEALHRQLAAAGETLAEIDGPEQLEALKRYHRIEATHPGNALADGWRELHETRRGKVLWICNTVNRAIEAADRFRAAGLTPILYHSRFRYIDRVERHSAVIEAFRRETPALAVCTQVAEVSLDLSAT